MREEERQGKEKKVKKFVVWREQWWWWCTGVDGGEAIKKGWYRMMSEEDADKRLI